MSFTFFVYSRYVTSFFLSLDKDMRGCAEHCHCRHNGEGGVGHQAEPVQHHRRKLPVTLNGAALLVIADLVCYNLRQTVGSEQQY